MLIAKEVAEFNDALWDTVHAVSGRAHGEWLLRGFSKTFQFLNTLEEEIRYQEGASADEGRG